MENEKWIDAIAERKPTKEDADERNCVLVWHVYNGVMVTGYHQFDSSRFLTHWMPCPKPPKNAAQRRAEIEY